MTPAMTPQSDGPTGATPVPETSAPDPSGPPLASRLPAMLAFDRIGAVYVLALIIVVFSIWAPDTFPRWDTLSQIVDNYAVTAMAALALIIPLSCGVFDISGAYTISLSGVIASYVMIHTGGDLALSIAAALGASLLVGILNGVVVVGMRIESLIGTLATGSLIQAANSLITNDTPLNDSLLTIGGFADIAQRQMLGLTLPVIYALVIAVALWYLMEGTATGRRLYAVGFNREASRLAGVKTERLRFISLMVSSFLAGAVGIVLASQIGSGSPTIGAPYLLSSFAAVFLGATQFKQGRFNAPGTVLAVLLLGTGITGLSLVNAQAWAGSVFTGVVLIAALAITGRQRRKVRSGRRILGWKRRGAAKDSAAADGAVGV